MAGESTAAASAQKHPHPLSKAPRRRSILGLSLLLLLGLLLIPLLTFTHRNKEAGADLEIYTEASRLLWSGATPYTTYTFTDGQRSQDLYYLYPPFLAAVMKSWTVLDRSMRYLAWSCLSYLALLLGAALLSTCITPPGWHPAWRFFGLALATVAFGPVWAGFRVGQIHAFIYLLLCAFVACDFHGRPRLAGACLALAVWIKMSPALLVLVPLRHRQWRLLAWFAGTAVAIGAVLLIDAGAEVFHEFFTQLPKITGGELFGREAVNLAVAPALNISCGSWGRTALEIIFLSTLVLPSSAITPRRRRLHEHAAAICIMIAISPIIWYHHLTWWLIPFFIICSESSGAHAKLHPHASACLALYLFVCWYEQGYVGFQGGGAPGAAVLHVVPLGLLFATALTVMHVQTNALRPNI